MDKDALSTGGTYKSFGFPRPDAKRCGDHEQSFSLNYSSGDVDSQNNDAGYDEVDFKPVSPIYLPFVSFINSFFLLVFQIVP